MNYKSINIQELIAKANNGDAEAQYQLSRSYFEGRSVERNPTMGIKWLKLAAEQGNEDAIFDLGIKYIWAAKSATRTFPKDCDF